MKKYYYCILTLLSLIISDVVYGENARVNATNINVTNLDNSTVFLLRNAFAWILFILFIIAIIGYFVYKEAVAIVNDERAFKIYKEDNKNEISKFLFRFGIVLHLFMFILSFGKSEIVYLIYPFVIFFWLIIMTRFIGLLFEKILLIIVGDTPINKVFFTIMRKKIIPSIIIIIIIFKVITMPSFRTCDRGNYSRQKACYSNIRVIQGAVEMYNMDTTPMMDDLNMTTLIKGGYIRGEIKCPEPQIKVKYTNIGKLSNTGEVSCGNDPIGDHIKREYDYWGNVKETIYDANKGHGSLSGNSDTQ